MAARATGLALAERAADSAGGLSFSAIPGAECGAIAVRWAELADRASGDNVFFHPDFAIPAIAHLGSGEVSVATVAETDGRLVAAAPFTRARLGHVAPAVCLWGHKYAPLGVPLVAGPPVATGLGALVEGLAPESSGLSLVVPDLPRDGAVAIALGRLAGESGRPLTLLNEHLRAMLLRPTGSADLRALQPLRRRKELGRQMRRMIEAGTVSVEAATEVGEVRAGFAEFLTLESAGWKGRGGTALASSPESAEFAREVVANRAASGGVRIDRIRVGDSPAAIVVSFTAGATAWTWKIAHDETFARFSPGAQLMLDAPAHIFADARIQQIDSCAVAGHPMIDRLWPDRLAVATFVLGPSGGSVLHRIGLAAAKAEIAARTNVRHLRERLG